MECTDAQPGSFSPAGVCTQACGSGGTTASIALGNHLSGLGARVHAYGVCDDEEYFYSFIQGIFDDLGATSDRLGAHSYGVQCRSFAQGFLF